MRLLTGPTGSGKTAFCLDRLREALRSGRTAVRLLTPTATLAQHLQNRLAREGLLLRTRTIQTLHAFIKERAGEIPQASAPVVYLVVEEVVRRVARPEFAAVAQLPGFCASLGRTIEEFSSAGCSAARLAGALPATPLGAAFLTVYEETERDLARRGLELRSRRLERAAARIAEEGAGGIEEAWLVGFHALPEPELAVIAALGRHCDLTLAFEAAEPRLLTLGFGEQALPHARPSPARAIVRAPSIEREAEEIARRILDQAAAGRSFREIGIIVRDAETYVPLLGSTLERFGIPARFYFDQNLEEHAVTRLLSGAVDALLSGWDHAQTMAALRLDPRHADHNALDRLDFAVREQIPNRGLDALRALTTDERLLRRIDGLAALEEWRGLALTSRAWAARLDALRQLFHADLLRAGHGDAHAMALEWRSQAEALDAFDEALAEAALGSSDAEREIPLETYWRAVKSVLRVKPLRLADGRRNVVHVLSAHEARQWVLPVIFVCGMVQQGFPHVPSQDPFFPDEARRHLNAAGIRVRTAAEFERDEQALFDSAVSRATLFVAVSYPQFDGRGDRNVRSLFLDSWPEPEEPARPVRPAPASAATARVPSAIQAPVLLDFLRERTQRISPTRLESFLQCPFQHFASRTLRLQPPPARPEERLDFLMQGTIVHETLAEWFRQPQEIEPLFDRLFTAAREKERIPRNFQTERMRNDMLDHLRAFLNDSRWPRGEFQSRLEEPFEIKVGDWVLSGKIDRLDEAADGRAFVIDYKYSRKENTRKKLKDENLLQAPLYLLAAERYFGLQPTGMFYIGLRGAVEYVGWSKIPVLESEEWKPGWVEESEQKAIEIVGQIRAGRVEVAPANPDHCRFCDARDVCRVETRGAFVQAEGRSA